MKIVRQGERPENKVGQFECNSCKSVIEAKAGEAKDTSSNYQGRYFYFDCPVCEHSVGVESKDFFAKRNL